MPVDFKTIVPNGSRVSSSFNPNRNAPTAGASTNHKGSDIAAPLGSSVVNQAEGKVVFVGNATGFGPNTVIVEHQLPDGSYAYRLYGHMGSASVKQGDTISAGAQIGTVGNEGIGTGPHLHMEERSYLEGERIPSNNIKGGYFSSDAHNPLKDSVLPNSGATPQPSTFDEVVIVAKRPVNIAGDAIDADLPDGTRVVSTSTTVNGQTTVTADLVDKDGHVLLHAGAGQTMERDPETGIVQVRTGNSDQVQQYDPATGEVTNALRTGSDAAHVYENLLDAFSNPQIPTDQGIQVADASGALPDTSSHANTFTNFLDAQGTTLSTAQQDALATQIDKLNLGGDKELSFYALPNGGALIANADGDIVGEINRNSATGDLNLKATAIAADGSVVEVNNHISELGQVVSDAAMVQGQASAMFNSLMAVNNWDHMSDLGKLSALVNLYNATDKLGEAFGATGNNLPGDLGAAAGYLQLAQGIQSGDSLIIANGINVVSDHAPDNAMNNALGSTAEGEAVPYLSYALAVRNFEENPEVAIGTMAGTYIGEGLGAAFGGPIGAAIGGAVGGMIGGMVGGLFGDDEPPPPPEGAVHFSWDESGHIQHTVDYNQSGGGDAANNIAASVQTMLQNLVDAHNAQTASTADDIAINPYLLPRMGFSGSGAWMEVVLPDGTTVREGVNQDSFAQRLLGVLQDNGGIAPAWQVQTQQQHYQQALQEGQTQEQAEAPLRLGAGGQAYAGDDAFSLQGNAAESADFKSQTFGALVVHLNDNPNVQAAQTQLTQVLRDVEGDGYFEQTQAVAAKDSAGNLQAVLAIDFNGDGIVQTRDILNLGGNADQSGNPTTEAALANEHADQQRNNMQWLDANSDGVLDKSDPAFAAIRLWVDVNQDGVQAGNEASSLSARHISSINFKTGAVTYEDGHTDALTAQTLKADTEGVKLTQINEVNADGTLHALDAGTVLEHEGYQGKVQITDEGGTRWVSEREQTYEQQAKRTGDWEGTVEQEAHRHGGGNVEGSPTETTATGATDLGPVKSQANVITQSTIDVDDVRVVSDAPTQAPAAQANAQTTVNAGDNRIKSNTTTIITTNTISTPSRLTDTRIVFVPTAQICLKNEIQAVTDSMIERSQSMFFGAGFNAGLGVLAAVGMGATLSAQAATEQRLTLVSDADSSSVSTTPNNSSASINASSVTFKQVDLGVFNVPQVVQTSSTASSSTGTEPTANLSQTVTAGTTFVQATVLVNPPVLSAQNKTSAVVSSDALVPASALQVPASNAQAPSLGYPVVQAETLPGTEDVVLRLTQSVLLANDSTPNASADPNAPALTITGVSAPVHGQVSLVNGEVLFAPDLNFHGTASFTYTVTDQYGLSTNGTTILEIAAVNDAPVTLGETATTAEDTAIVFTQAELLANDSDVDVGTDGQVLRISAVSGAANGAVSMLANGDIRFVPAANYHGPAEFTYTVSDGSAAEGAGATTNAKVNLTITAVNDVPVAIGDVFITAEDTTTVLTPQQLLGNDTDNDIATDADVLTITRVFGPQHCTATLNADGTISFTPDANYHGTVRFSYEITDTQGATSTAFVVAGVNAVNDAPVGYADGFSSLEDNIVTLSQTDLLGNDTDNDIATDGDVLSVASVINATNGQVRLLANGKIEFVPDNNFHGVATFDYVVSDSLGATSLSTVTLHVGAVNDLPVVVNETVTATEDTLFATTANALLANDTDVDTATDGQVLSIAQVKNAQHGVVMMDVNGRITFTPDTDFHGTASFEYVVSDGTCTGAGGLRTGTVTLNVQAVNDAPVTQGESQMTAEDTDIVLTQAQLLANDSDVDVATDGQVLRINAVSGATNGTVIMLANGDIRFSPNLNYHGPAEFTYTVSDGNGGSTDAKVNLTITAVNDAPVVVDDVIAATEDTPFYIEAASLLANDSDVDTATDGQVLSISAVNAIAGETHGTVNLVTQPDGTQQVQFTPDLNYHGVATFNYTVSDGNGGFATAIATVNIAAVNDAPVTQGESYASDEDIGLIFTQAQLLRNDSDVDVATDGQVLSISRVGQAEHGTVWLDAQGNLRFVPDANYHGPAKFTYWVSDGLAANGAGAEVPATVTLTLFAVNDLPVVTGETINTNEDTTLLFNPVSLLANDSDVDMATDGQTLSITAVNNATHGTVDFVTQSDGTQRIAFTPEANYFGMASYQYTVSDGTGGTAMTTVVLNLAQVNDTPVAANDSLNSTQEDMALHISFASLLGNDTDADSHNAQWGSTNDVLTVAVVGNAVHGTVALVNGEVVFTPDANYHGPASFAYQVSDSSGAVSQALATFSVTAVNDVPVAVGETISENEDTTLVISQAALLQNDSDVDTATDGQILSITRLTNAQHGSVTLNANGTISFVPEANFYGNASFDYTVSDGNGGVTTTTATIALANVNDAPVATGETIAGVEDQTLTIVAGALLQNDSDVDNVHADLVISRVQSGSGGTVSLNASGNVVFAPTVNYNGNATFTYWVKDPAGLESNAVTTTVVLAAVNDAPSAQGEVVMGASEDAVFNINKATLLANDHDIDDADSALSLSWVGNATGGVVSLDTSGNVVFTPTLNFNGNATFQYKVRDAAGLESRVVQAVIPLAAVNDVPVAVDDQFTTYNNSTLTVAFNQLTSNDSDTENDALTVSGVRDHANGHASIVNGQVQFVANSGFAGAASFDYLVDDGHGGQAWATAFVDVVTPPNQYPMVAIRQEVAHSAASWSSGTVSYSAGNYLDKLIIEFSTTDDGLGPISIELVSASKYTFNGINASMFSPAWWGWGDGLSGVSLDMTNRLITFSTNGGSERGFNQYQTIWKVTDDKGVSNVWHYNEISYQNYQLTSESYCEHSGYFTPPVILDLNNDGVHFTSLQNSSITMDVNFDGIQDKMAWAGTDDGVLVWDKDRNGCISDASEFGFQTLKLGAQTDLEGLQALDTNGNGLLDADDEKFAEFAVWQDANGNGVTDAGEFKTLTELGIANINLHSDGQVRDAGTLLANRHIGETDATVMGNAAFTRTDGSTGLVADTMLAYEAGHATSTITNTAVVDTSAQSAEIIRQALFFNQVCNTAISIDSTPLGFVPIQSDVQLHDMLVSPQDSSHLLIRSA